MSSSRSSRDSLESAVRKKPDILVLDANILIRAVLGQHVRGLLAKYGGRIEFFAPAAVFDEAREHLPGVVQSRDIPVEPAMACLDALSTVIKPVDFETYGSFEVIARQ